VGLNTSSGPERVGHESGNNQQNAADESQHAVERGTSGCATLRDGSRDALDRCAALDTKDLRADQRRAEQQHDGQQPTDRVTDLDERKHLHGERQDQGRE